MTDDGRNLAQAGKLRRAPAPLAGDDLVALRLPLRADIEGAHDDGLYDSLNSNGIRKLLERLLPQIGARLIAAALQEVERKLGQFLALRGFISARCGGYAACRGGSQQIRESAAKSGSLLDHDRAIITN